MLICKDAKIEIVPQLVADDRLAGSILIEPWTTSWTRRVLANQNKIERERENKLQSFNYPRKHILSTFSSAPPRAPASLLNIINSTENTKLPTQCHSLVRIHTSKPLSPPLFRYLILTLALLNSSNPGPSKPDPPPGSSNQSSNPGNPTQRPNTTGNAVNLPDICPYPNTHPPGERPANGYTHLSRDPHRKERKEHTDGLKIRVNADLAVDLTIKGELYGDLILGIITDDKDDKK